jgi:shikimate 5-dehydrogenase
VSEQSQPIFRSGDETRTPGRSVSTTSSEMPAAPSPPVRTAVVTKSALAADVMYIFDPVTR